MTYQPVTDLQLSQLKVEWIALEDIKPNKYNPNKMSWQDRMLLRQSLLEDGWTQPIVTLPDGTIVDGEQRWTVAQQDITPEDIQEIIAKMRGRQAEGYPESESILERLTISKQRLELALEEGRPATLAAITGGLVPRTILDLGDDAHKMISTIRHNRARGMHQIDAMADITQDLLKLGLDIDDLETRLGMDDEEVERFIQAAAGEAEALASQTEGGFSQAWDVISATELSDDEAFQRNLDRSAAAAQVSKDHQLQLAEREQEIERRRTEALANAEASVSRPLTQIERDVIEHNITAALPSPEPPKPPQLRKIVAFVTPEEYADVQSVCGEDVRADALVRLCQWAHSQGYAPPGAQAN